MANISGQPIRFPSQDEIIDQSDPNNTYIGKAKIGSATSAAVWQIQKLATVSGVLTISWANGDNKFTKIWDNHTALSYS